MDKKYLTLEFEEDLAELIERIARIKGSDDLCEYIYALIAFDIFELYGCGKDACPAHSFAHSLKETGNE